MLPRRRYSRCSEIAGRILDILVAATALVILSPIVVLIAAAILLVSGRPVLFKQVRIGRDGRPFSILKFRKFRQKSGPSGLPLTLCNDKRMSPIGSFLARTKLDELPQLLNVLRGEMSIVGPRPESLDFQDCFTPGTQLVLDFRPGIFGPSQVALRNECALYPTNSDPTVFYREVLFPLKANLDLAYYPNRTLISDIKWIAAGVFAVLGVYRSSDPGTFLAGFDQMIRVSTTAHNPAAE